jgi:hypothetical protein
MLTLYKNNEISEQEYRALDVISQSLLRKYALSSTPLHFWFQNRVDTKVTSAMELGTLLHRRVELGDAYFNSHTSLPKGMRKGTKAYKEYKEIHKEKTLVKHGDAKLVESMYRSIITHGGASKLLSEGFAEESIVGEIDGIKIKGRFDFRNPKLKVLLDVKTALTGNPFEFKGFAKTVKDSKYDWQAAFYLEMIRRITGEDYSFVFVVVEKQYPYACSLHTLTPEDLEAAHREVFECLKEFNSRKLNNDWGHGYGSKIHTLNIRGSI